MPIHDWTRVSAGTWHDFHVAWIAEIRKALNGGLLPADFYAQAEQITGPFGPDVLTLQTTGGDTNGSVAPAPPRVRWVVEADMDDYVLKRRTLVIRHVSGDRIVALVEILSPGNKAARAPFRAFVDKAVEALYRGYHLLVIDLFPPTPRDPQGIHAAIWGDFAEVDFTPPAEEPLTLAAYSAGATKRAYVEATAVGKDLVAMPLFLEPEWYVEVPLEQTYREAYEGMPRRWRAVLEGNRPDG